ncbi:MAG: hypothetical protein JRI23_08950 [Deltaproteobacteria bacterium]|jgi:hypothetical protein|nr:hypothetical protein [Deltaproteobacteria bacterium]MBW2531765.1 hypothetical protein [Deltaproteobacteria bacterium]
MTQALGTLFLQGALSPLHDAGQRIMARDVPAGLCALAATDLLAAVHAATAVVAREAGVREVDVSGLLPMHDLQTELSDLGRQQYAALQAWRQHAGHIGGLLEGVADLTQDGRPPDVSLCLQRLAAKVRADKAWSEPLLALSETCHRYGELLEHCQRILDGGVTLAVARRSRRRRRLSLVVAVATVTLLAAGSGTGWWLRAQGAHDRVAALLDDDDVCSVEKVASDDVELTSGRIQRTVADRRQQCSSLREQERKAEEERRHEEEQAKRLAARQRAHADQCAALAAAIAKGRLGDEHEATAGKGAALLSRVAQGEIQAADLAPTAPELPCADTPSVAAIEGAFAKAVLSSTDLWISAEDVSMAVQTALTKHKAVLRERPKLLFGLHADTQAQRALISGRPDAVARALRLCGLKRSLEIVRGSYCDALENAQGIAG